MSTITLPRIEYQDLKKKAESYDRLVKTIQLDAEIYKMPEPIKHVYLKGKAAKRLDRRVTQALKEYKTGKTKPFKFS